MTELAAAFLRLADYCLKRADSARASGDEARAVRLELAAASHMENALRH